MDAQRNFILRKGMKLRCLSLNNDISDPMFNLYFTSAEEALISLYKAQSMTEYNNELIFINTFVLNEDIVINPGIVGESVLRSIINTSVSQETIGTAIQQDCEYLDRDNLRVDGYVVPFEVAIEQNFDSNRPRYIIGKLTTYIICKSNLLMHLGSFKIDLTAFEQLIYNIVGNWYENREQGNRPSLTSAMLIAFLAERQPELDVVLERHLIQPTTPGLATSPFSPPQQYVRQTGLVSPSKTNPGFDLFFGINSDVLRIMGLNMDLVDLLNFCKTSKTLNRQLCENEVFWQEKVRMDFGQPVEDKKPGGLGWKQYYAQRKRITNFFTPTYAFDLFDPLIRQLHDDEDPRYVEPIEDDIFEEVVNIALITRELPTTVLRREHDLIHVDSRWKNNPIPRDRLLNIFNWDYLLRQLIYYLRRLPEYDPELGERVKELELAIARRRLIARKDFRRRRLAFEEEALNIQNPDIPIPDYRGEIDVNVDINGQIREEIHQEQDEPPDELF